MLCNFLQWSVSRISLSLQSTELWLSKPPKLLPEDSIYRDLVVVACFEVFVDTTSVAEKKLLPVDSVVSKKKMQL